VTVGARLMSRVVRRRVDLSLVTGAAQGGGLHCAQELMRLMALWAR
jgi:hypothetical protein